MLEVNGVKFPLDRKYYTKHDCHVWLKVEGETVRIGMDGFLTENAGHLNFITVDDEPIKKGESIGTYESAKFVSKIYSPISGEVVEMNEEIIDNPRKINEEPYSSWILAIRPDDLEKDLGSGDILGSEDQIRAYIKKEFERLDPHDE
jgi:glycine cleavage system H protein